MPRTSTTPKTDLTPTEITEVPISDEARNERIYRSMAIELLGDALDRLSRYQRLLSISLETARNLAASVLVNFYESESGN